MRRECFLDVEQLRSLSRTVLAISGPNGGVPNLAGKAELRQPHKSPQCDCQANEHVC